MQPPAPIAVLQQPAASAGCTPTQADPSSGLQWLTPRHVCRVVSAELTQPQSRQAHPDLDIREVHSTSAWMSGVSKATASEGSCSACSTWSASAHGSSDQPDGSRLHNAAAAQSTAWAEPVTLPSRPSASRSLDVTEADRIRLQTTISQQAIRAQGWTAATVPSIPLQSLRASQSRPLVTCDLQTVQ